MAVLHYFVYKDISGCSTWQRGREPGLNFVATLLEKVSQAVFPVLLVPKRSGSEPVGHSG